MMAAAGLDLAGSLQADDPIPHRHWRNMYSRRTTLWFLGTALLIAVGLAIVITRPFLNPIAFAIILAVVFHPVHQRVLLWTKQRRDVAALLSTLALLFLFCVPVLLLATVATNEAINAAQYLT